MHTERHKKISFICSNRKTSNKTIKEVGYVCTISTSCRCRWKIKVVSSSPSRIRCFTGSWISNFVVLVNECVQEIVRYMRSALHQTYTTIFIIHTFRMHKISQVAAKLPFTMDAPVYVCVCALYMYTYTHNKVNKRFTMKK